MGPFIPRQYEGAQRGETLTLADGIRPSGARLSGRDRDSRLFLGEQPQEQLPSDVVLDQSELPSEDFQIFGVRKFFHGVLALGVTRSGW